MRCVECALASPAIPDDWPLLAVAPSLRYRLVTGLTNALGCALLGAIVFFLGSMLGGALPRLLTGAVLTMSALVALAVEWIVLLACFTGVVLSLSGIRSAALFSFSKTALDFHDVIKSYDTSVDELLDENAKETKFVDRQFKLADVRNVSVRQGFLGRQLGCGDIEIWGTKDSRPLIIPGVINPNGFKQRLELILEHRANAAAN